jgi:hypothetical protein
MENERPDLGDLPQKEQEAGHDKPPTSPIEIRRILRPLLPPLAQLFIRPDGAIDKELLEECGRAYSAVNHCRGGTLSKEFWEYTLEYDGDLGFEEWLAKKQAGMIIPFDSELDQWAKEQWAKIAPKVVPFNRATPTPKAEPSEPAEPDHHPS